MLFYEIKIHYDRQTGENNPGKVKETYLVEGINCSDVETRLLTDLKPFISGDHEVTSCKKMQLYDFFPLRDGEFWFLLRLEMIIIDNDKEKRKVVSVLVQADTIGAALERIGHELNADFEVISITKSPIMDIIRSVK